MNSEEEQEYITEDEYTESQSSRRRKRRRINPSRTTSEVVDITRDAIFEPVIQVLSERYGTQEMREKYDDDFDQFMEDLLPDCQAAAIKFMQQLGETEQYLDQARPLTGLEIRELLQTLDTLDDNDTPTISASLLRRKLHIERSKVRSRLLHIAKSPSEDGPPKPLSVPTASAANPEVLDALYAIGSTPYENSFLSRLQGAFPRLTHGVLAVDWEIRSPWMDVLTDIREHFTLMHPEHEQPLEIAAPVEYATLRPEHLPQVHDLLTRTFWAGIDVADCIDYTPEKCTIVATYKRLIVGAAFLSSPQETYITYLAVRAGWENAHIATQMLYHLITLNPHKDITLHVSVNNPAMLLYNRFGFKAEEFIVGFYEDYLDPQSRMSKNAFRLRLRR